MAKRMSVFMEHLIACDLTVYGLSIPDKYCLIKLVANFMLTVV